MYIVLYVIDGKQARFLSEAGDDFRVGEWGGG
jgi:hypothetical protein